jgi:tetratricopeptide (TPR) repeat protein
VSDLELFRYIPRTEEQGRILAEAARVQRTGQSRAVLLYGQGGIGKTRLVRQLPGVYQDQKIKWLEPIDVDDSQHWLLSNLETYVALQLDPDSEYFRPYLDYVSELPRHRLMPISRESILSYLNRIKEVFAQCYKKYIDETGNSVVIIFDTVEAIRGIYLLRTLTQWMKALPGTLFILAGRPLPNAADGRDSIETAMQDPAPGMDVTTVLLGEFNAADCREYLAPIGLSPEETEKLVHLTQGHPLWLAFTVDYLRTAGLPREMQDPLEEIKADLPYHGVPTSAGRERAESFKQRLVAPYHEADFWHEAIRRLAVVRESISKPIWLRLMDDTPWPADIADGDQAWDTLRGFDWIRLRASKRYVTLHDAVAEELSQRVITLHDHDGRRRQELWRRAADIYAGQAGDLEGRLTEKQSDVDRRLGAARKQPGSARMSAGEEAALIREVTELDGWRQELNQLRASHLFYQLLSSFTEGAQQFLRLLSKAREDHDVLFEDLLAFQMQRFLPGGADESTLGDTVGAAISSFRDWLRNGGRDSHLDIGLEMATYLNAREQVDAALNLLEQLPEPEPQDHTRRYRLGNLQGNACLRLPGRVREGRERFEDALAEASQFPLEDDRDRYRADAYKELGFYYRNIGRWKDADEAYVMARNAILRVLSMDSPDSDREEMASIYTNWAYVKGIGGKYDDGINLVASAINLRKRIGRPHAQAISCSVKGEVYRYQRQFRAAWAAYEEAAQLFEDQNSWSWLGVIYQEQAICLFQAIPAGVQLPSPKPPAEHAESLILKSLELCRDLNARYYPSALNRAGRIFADKEPDRGLGYLLEGADRAQGLSDGWFWMANLVEYAGLCYRIWSATGDRGYLEKIPAIADRLLETEEAELEFPELRGRWDILQGHLAMHAGLDGDDAMLEVALGNYRTGFPLITHGWVGSYGASAIPEEFRKFGELFWRLSAQTRERWLRDLYRSWREPEESATQLLALLEELY